MDNTWSKAIQAYKAVFGKEPELADFDSRLMFQKTIYLVRQLGVNFGDMDFTWYNRGPYAFRIAGIYPKGTHLPHGLTKEEIGTIESNKGMLLELLSKPSDAELYASVAYLLFEEHLDENGVVAKMDLIKPWFTKEQVTTAIGKVKAYFPESRLIN